MMKTGLAKYDWFQVAYEGYTPCSHVLSNLETQLSNYTIEVIVDINCKDVRYLIPKLIKILDMCAFNEIELHTIDKGNLPLFCVEAQTNIEKVPTIIFRKDKEEKIRITEKISIASSIEKEMELLLTNVNL